MNTHQAAQQVRFKFLDSLRGLAALAVTLFHIHGLFGVVSSYSFPSYLEYIFSNGNLGVQVFFVLSGFVIAYSIRNANFNSKFVLEFFIKRSIRLDPPYWIALLLMLSATLLFTILIRNESPFDGFQILTNFFYLHAFFDFDPINPVAWTLCIELQFYMFLVVILSLLFRLEKKYLQSPERPSPFFLLFFAVLLFVSLESNVHLFSYFPIKDDITSLFIPYWYGFFIGCAVCWNLIGWISRNALYAFFGIIAFYGFYSMDILIWATLCIAGMIFLMGCTKNLATCIVSPVFQYLGKISYSLYLMHWLAASNCILFLSKRIGTDNEFKILAIFMFSLIASIAVAHVFYICVELPCLNLSKKYEKKPSSQKLVSDSH